MKKYLSFEEKVRSFKGRVNRLKEKLGSEPVPYAEHWEKKKERIIEEFIESVIKRFESFVETGTGHLIVDFSLDSLSSLFRDEVEDTLVRLEKLGFAVKYFGPDYLLCSNSSIHVALYGEESKIRNSSDFSDIIGNGAIGH